VILLGDQQIAGVGSRGDADYVGGSDPIAVDPALAGVRDLVGFDGEESTLQHRDPAVPGPWLRFLHGARR
jgi:hypothetical protein